MSSPACSRTEVAIAARWYVRQDTTHRHRAYLREPSRTGVKPTIPAVPEFWRWMLAPEQRDWRFYTVVLYMGCDLLCKGKGRESECPVDYIARLCRTWQLAREEGRDLETCHECGVGQSRWLAIERRAACQRCTDARVGLQGVLL